MSVYLCVEDKTEYKSDCFFRLVEKIDKAKVCALQNWNNTLWKTTAYEMDYIKMRENQSRVLANIYQSIIMIKILPKQTAQVADFLQHIEQQYHRNNNVTKLLDKLEEMLAYMKEEPLPQDRAEFEARAVLFYMLKQLEEFLYLKNQFILNIMHNYYAYLLLAVSILTTVKIFQFLHSPYCISGQYVLCRKENLIVVSITAKNKKKLFRCYEIYYDL